MADVFTIDDLNALAALTAADEFPVWDSEESGEPTKKITAQNMTASVKTLGSLVNTSEMNDAIQQSTNDVIRTGDVVDNLTNTDPTKVLAAPQGKALNDKIIQLNPTTVIIRISEITPGTYNYTATKNSWYRTTLLDNSTLKINGIVVGYCNTGRYDVVIPVEALTVITLEGTGTIRELVN